MRCLSTYATWCLLPACVMGAVSIGAVASGHSRSQAIDLVQTACAAAVIACAIRIILCVKSLTGAKTGAEQGTDEGVHQRLAESYLSTIRSLVFAIDAKDSYTKAHAARVQETAIAIAEQMGLSPAEVEGIRTAALVHDIGKIGIPEHILRKPGKLAPEELKAFQEHPAIGSQIIGSVEFPWPIAAMIRGHHERWDGSGYPDGLRGEDIPLGARILAVADVFDALTSDRSYRDRLSKEAAAAHIARLSGNHFDPKVVRAFTAAAGRLAISVQATADNSPTETAPPQKQEKEHITNQSNVLRSNRELFALSDITRALSSALNPREAVSLVAEKVRSALEADTCAIFLHDDEDATRLVANGVAGRNDRFFHEASTKLGEGVTGAVAATGRPYRGPYQKSDIVLTASTDQWTELGSCMAVPITRGGSPLGCINVYSRSLDGFDEDALSLLMLLTSRTAGALERASIRMRTEKNAAVDVLTGLMSSAFLLKALQAILSDPSRQPVSILSISLDNFKAVNEMMGHHTGDRLLQTVGRLIKDTVGTNNPVARCGGDKFTAAAIGADTAEARRLVERIERCFAAYCDMAHIPTACRAGISIGAASCPEDGNTADDLLTAAEARQHEIKHRKKREQERAA